MKTDSRIFVAGHRGLVGSAITRSLKNEGYSNLILRDRNQLDLVDQSAVHAFFKAHNIEYVFLAAAKVGGIHANSSYQADFLYENLMIASNVIHASFEYSVKKLLFLGSSCIYPRLAPQPIQESSLLSGYLEPTNKGYAIAKIAGLKLCEMYQKQYGKCFISAMPTNLYGPGDNFHPMNSHVIPGLLYRFHQAKIKQDRKVAIWGTGSPKREFLHVDDLATALLLLMQKYEGPETINVGSGQEYSIYELAQVIKEVVGFDGNIEFDSTFPDGTPRKILDNSKIQNLNWEPIYNLKDGLQSTYNWAVTTGIL